MLQFWKKNKVMTILVTEGPDCCVALRAIEDLFDLSLCSNYQSADGSYLFSADNMMSDLC